MKIGQQDFLTEYIKDKPDWNIYNNNEYIKQAGNDFYNIDCHFNENEIPAYECKISTCELGNIEIAIFWIPETYEKFKTILDIFLGMK